MPGYPQASSVESILPKRCVYTHGRILRHIKYRLWTKQIKNDWPKETQKKCPIKVIQTVTRWLRDSLWVYMYVYPHVLYSFFPLNKLYLFHYFLSLWEFFSAKLKGQGPCHWLLVDWLGSGSSTAVTWHQSLAGNPSPVPSHCRPRLPKIKLS